MTRLNCIGMTIEMYFAVIAGLWLLACFVTTKLKHSGTIYRAIVFQTLFGVYMGILASIICYKTGDWKAFWFPCEIILMLPVYRFIPKIAKYVIRRNTSYDK